MCKLQAEVVRAWDVRDVSDQVHSMGAKWVTVDFKVGCSVHMQNMGNKLSNV